MLSIKARGKLSQQTTEKVNKLVYKPFASTQDFMLQAMFLTSYMYSSPRHVSFMYHVLLDY